jgi:hypothetical protein
MATPSRDPQAFSIASLALPAEVVANKSSVGGALVNYRETMLG